MKAIDRNLLVFSTASMLFFGIFTVRNMITIKEAASLHENAEAESIEQVEEKIWSNWEETKIAFYDMNDKKTGITLRFRNNGKKVQVRSGALKAESSCHSEDTFDFNKGFELATKRLIVKYLDNQVKSIAKGM